MSSHRQQLWSRRYCPDSWRCIIPGHQRYHCRHFGKCWSSKTMWWDEVVRQETKRSYIPSQDWHKAPYNQGQLAGLGKGEGTTEEAKLPLWEQAGVLAGLWDRLWGKVKGLLHRDQVSHKQRLVQVRWKYHYLRSLGFSSKEARKMRNWGWNRINQFCKEQGLRPEHPKKANPGKPSPPAKPTPQQGGLGPPHHSNLWQFLKSQGISLLIILAVITVLAGILSNTQKPEPYDFNQPTHYQQLERR